MGAYDDILAALISMRNTIATQLINLRYQYKQGNITGGNYQTYAPPLDNASVYIDPMITNLDVVNAGGAGAAQAKTDMITDLDAQYNALYPVFNHLYLEYQQGSVPPTTYAYFAPPMGNCLDAITSVRTNLDILLP